MGKLDGRIALITGGDHGVGLQTAKEFVNEGAYVFITGGSQSQLAAAVKEIEAGELRRTRVGRNVAGIQGELSNAGDLDRMLAQIEREKGKLDVVFAASNEAMSPNPERENHSSLDIFMNGMFATVGKAIPVLRDGACILLLSVSPKETVSRNDSVKENGIRSFWRTWINELKDRRIRLNAVNPGPASTGQLKDLRMSGERNKMLTSDRPRSRSLSLVEEVAEAVVFLASDESAHIAGKDLIVGGNSLPDDFPFGRLGTPEEVAQAVVFLASDDSRGITGKELFVGAGFSELGILVGDDLKINLEMSLIRARRKA